MEKRIEESLGLETKKFVESYEWLERAMPPTLFEEVSEEQKMLIVHHLMGLSYQEYFSVINLGEMAVALCVEEPGIDLKILEYCSMYAIRNYQTYISKENLAFIGKKLRIALLKFQESKISGEMSRIEIDELLIYLRKRNTEITEEEFHSAIQSFDPRSLKGLPIDRIALALEMYIRAKTRDHCQYEVIYNEDWEGSHKSSLQVVMAWRNTPKHNFLFQIAKVIFRHQLVMNDMHATYVEPHSKENVLVMILSIHGANGEAAWDAADIADFLRELVRIKFFSAVDLVEEELINARIVSGNFGIFIRSFIPLIHQFLLHLNPNFYTPELIEEAFCSQPEMIAKLCAVFDAKFHPEKRSLERYEELRKTVAVEIGKLDTGNESYDALKKNVLLQSLRFIQFTLKTNFYRRNITALSFRLDSRFMEDLPYNQSKLFPEIPYGIFYFFGMNFFGFHVRFKDLARGGLRTVSIQNREQFKTERNHVFTECYHLAYTQHKKNKEIPEGGSKGIIFIRPYDRLDPELAILRRDLESMRPPTVDIEAKVEQYRQEQRLEQLHAAQRSYIESLITLVNCDLDGRIRAKHVVDYYMKPEYLYIGPDENASNEVIEWIANYSKKFDYRPKSAFITSKPKYGINHKHYGVTSLGVMIYVASLLKFIGIEPETDRFTLKLSGGPDGDVAGNVINYLHQWYPNTAKIVALTDISGTVQDLEGLDLEVMAELFRAGKPIRHYPYEKLHEGAFLIDIQTKMSPSPYIQKVLCVRKKTGQVVEDWLSGSEANYMLRHNMHSVPCDVFVTAGGRPRTLNEENWKGFLDETGKPTAKIIVEGANLYLTNEARAQLEERGVLIVKDSSANKCGVICSSYEVICGLTLEDELFFDHKESIVEQIMVKLRQATEHEAELIIDTFAETNIAMTEISNEISERMNKYKYEILESLLNIPLPRDENHPLNKILLAYCLPLLRENYKHRIINEIPENHKKAIISAYVASQSVYRKGLIWSPSIVDILPIIVQELAHY